MKTLSRRVWQALAGGAATLACAALMFPATAATAADEPLPAQTTPAQEPGIVRTLGGGPFRISAEIASCRMSPDGREIFAAHENEAHITVLDATTGLPKMQIPMFGYTSDLSPDGHMLSGIRESFENGKLLRPFGVWKWPERSALWVRDDLGMPSFSKFSPDGKMLAVGGSIPRVRSGNRLTVFEAATGRELWQTDIADSGGSFPGSLVWLGNDWVAVSFSKTDGKNVQIFQAATGQPVEADSEILKDAPDQAKLATALHAPVLVIFTELSFEVVKRTAENHLESVFRDSGEGDGYDPEFFFRSVELSPDGKFLFVATCSYCRIYDTEKRALQRKIPLGFSSASFSHGGETLTAGLHSGVTLLATSNWDPRPGGTPPAHEHPVGQLAFSPDGKLLASSDGEVILLWDWQSGRAVARIPRPTTKRDFHHMIFHPKDTLLIAGDGAQVSWWDYAHLPATTSGAPADAPEPTHKQMLHMNVPPDQIHSHHLCLDAGGKRLLAMINRTAVVIDLGSNPREKGKDIRQLTLGSFGQFEWIEDIALRSDGQRFSFVAGLQLRSFDIAPEKKIGEWEIPGCERAAAFSPDGRWFVTNGKTRQDQAVVIDAETGAVEMTLPLSESDGILQRRMGDSKAWSADSGKLASASYNNLEGWAGFRVWDMKSGKTLGTRRTSHGRITAITFAPDGRHFAAANADGSIQIWDLDKALTK